MPITATNRTLTSKRQWQLSLQVRCDEFRYEVEALGIQHQVSSALSYRQCYWAVLDEKNPQVTTSTIDAHGAKLRRVEVIIDELVAS
jgi:hypothetical protein